MKKDRQIEEVNSIISDNKKDQKKKSKNSLHKNNNHHINDNSFGGYSSIEFDSMRDSSNSNNCNKNSKKEIENMKHLKNSFSWSYDSKAKKFKKENKKNEQISIVEEEKEGNKIEDKKKELIKESKQISIIKKFHKIYQTLSGKCFVVETEIEKQTAIEYHNKLLNLEVLIFMLSVLSLINGIVYYELSFSGEGELKDTKHYIILLYFLHFLTILLFVALIMKELVHIEQDLYMQIVNKDENLINSNRYIYILFYFIVFFLQPSPIFKGLTYQENNPENPNGKTIYSVNAMLTVVLLLRGFFIIRPLLYISIFYDPETGYCCRQFNFKSSLMFTLKCQSNYSSLRLFSLAFLLVLFGLAYAVRIFERPANDNFDHYCNAIWLVVVTMTTVGYGELTAKTTGGRIISVISCLAGVFLVSMVIVSITSTLSLQSHEYTLLAIMKKTESMEKKKEVASKVIAKYISIVLKNCNGHNYSRIITSYKLTKELKEYIREFNLLSKESIDPSSTDFISFHNRIGFFNEFQKQILTRRQKIKERFMQLQDRIQNLSDKGII